MHAEARTSKQTNGVYRFRFRFAVLLFERRWMVERQKRFGNIYFYVYTPGGKPLGVALVNGHGPVLIMIPFPSPLV